MPTKKDPLSASLVRLAMTIHHGNVFAAKEGALFVHPAGESDPCLVHVTTHDGKPDLIEFHGGANAIEFARRFALKLGRKDVPLPGGGPPILLLAFTALRNIVPQLRRILQHGGFTARAESIAPVFAALRAERDPRSPNRTEMKRMAACLKLLLDAAADGPVRQGSLLFDDEVPVLSAVAGEGSGRAVGMWSRALLPPPDAALLQLDVDPALRSAPRRGGRWLAGFRAVPAPEGDEAIDLFALFTEQGDPVKVIQAQPVQVGRVACMTLDAMATDPEESASGRPDAIVFTHRGVWRWLSPLLEDLGVASSCEASPRFDELAADLHIEDAEPDEADADDDEPPECGLAHTLDEWKAADQLLHEAILEHVQHSPEMPEAFVDYAGGVEEAKDTSAQLAMMLPSFAEWFAAEWEEGESGSPLVDRWMGRATGAIFELLDARASATVSLFRVDRIDVEGGRVDVVDIFSGERHTLLDRAMAGSARVDFILPLRMLDITPGRFALLAGPVLSPLEIESAIEWVEERAGPIDWEELSTESSCLGLLFAWRANRRGAVRNLANADGDPLEFNEATFELDDESAFILALERRADVQSPKPGNSEIAWIWFREDEAGESATPLAWITVAEGRATVAVTSQKRLAAARRWLEALGGVRFIATRRTDSREALSARREAGETGAPEARRASAPLDPVAERAIRERLHAIQLAWLDKKVPMFGNRTPREVSRTPEGRKRVAASIRSMPPMLGPNGAWIEPPRAEMLREIGVEDGA